MWFWTLTAAHAAPISAWLEFGPEKQPSAAFADAESDPNALEFAPPLRGASDGPPAGWQAVSVPSPGEGVRWLATWLTVPSLAKGTLTVTCAAPTAVILDSDRLATHDGGDEPTQDDLTLEPGTHLLLLGATAPLTVDLDLGDGAWTAAAAPTRGSRLTDVIDATAVTDLALAPDGKHVALSLQTPAAESDKAWRRVDILRTADGTRTHTLDGATAIAWRPDGAAWASLRRHEDDVTVALTPLVGPGRDLVTLPHLESVRWLPDGTALVASQGRPPEETPDGKRLRGTPDRWRDHRDVARLLEISLDGHVRALTGSDDEVALYDVSADSRTLYVGIERHDTAVHPYRGVDVFALDRASLVTSPLFSAPFLDDIRALPSGELLVRGGASTFGAIRADRNDYDGEAFVWSPGSARARTETFDPSVTGAEVGPAGVVLLAEDRDRIRMFRLDPDRGQPVPMDVGHDSVTDFSAAADADVVGWVASSTHEPPVVGVTIRGRPRALWRPDRESLAEVRFGRLEAWDAALPDGSVLPGRIHFPGDFDPARSWPVIVYYYGGTNPVSRIFGGRYPHDVWTAHGYVVYVPQPSGATGFGAEPAARHVGDWGARTADEVIAGTRAFLAAHAWADPKRVGNIGASYGGFLTMEILTRTDLFAAAVAHAGISNLTSYWGEGWWGHLYSAVASGEALPWTDQGLYVGHSPIYRADRIHTPLLLTHGADDTNVPVGESDAMYTALKVLGRDVEMLRFAHEDHWIVGRDRRFLWARSIIAWFDWKLKGESGWWDHLWPAPDQGSRRGTAPDR